MITRFLISAAVIGGAISMSTPKVMKGPEQLGNRQKPVQLAQWYPGMPYPMGPPQRHYYPPPPYFSGPYNPYDDGANNRYFRVPNYDPRVDPRMFQPPPPPYGRPPWMFPH